MDLQSDRLIQRSNIDIDYYNYTGHFSLENPDNFTVENSPRPVYLVVGSTPLLIASALTIFVSLIAIILNATILLAFRQNRPLINAFTIHILDLTIINLAVGVTLTVFFIPVHNFHEGCLRIRAVCAVYRSLTFLMRYMVMHQHWVICLDRWLALLVPVWYSTEKRTRYAWMSTLFFLFTGLLWTFIVVGVEFSIALPEGAYCGEPIRTSLLPVVVALTVMVPQGFIYVSNPFLLFLVWKRRNGGGSVRRQTSMAPDQGMKVLTHAKLSTKLQNSNRLRIVNRLEHVFSKGFPSNSSYFERHVPSKKLFFAVSQIDHGASMVAKA